MDEKKHLILLDECKDITSKVDSITPNSLNGYDIKYYNSNTIYPFRKHRLKYIKNPNTINTEDVIVYKNDNPIDNIELILSFIDDNKNEYIKLITPRKNLLFNRKQIKIEYVLKNKEKYINYFKEIVQITGNIKNDTEDENEETEQRNSLVDQYEKIEKINSQTALATYLGNENNVTYSFNPPIFPFSYNLSQKDAIEKALSQHLSLISGPPGTGKTQTILNIVANLVMAGKSVAVVSNNNSAIKNVQDKFKSNDINFFSAFLGNNENKKVFIENQNDEPLDLKGWVLKKDDYTNLKNKLTEDKKEIDELLKIKTDISKLKSELSELLTEEYYFNTHKNLFITLPIIFKTAEEYLEFYYSYNIALNYNGKVSLVFKILKSIQFRINLFKITKYESYQINNFIQKQYYALYKKELEFLLSQKMSKIEGVEFDEKMQQYTKESMKLFKAYLANRFNGVKKIFKRYELTSSSHDFINRYPVVFSTTHSLKNCLNDQYVFDYLIIDEASQIDIATGALTLSCAYNAVVVGDSRQLPPITRSDLKSSLNDIFKKYEFNEGYNYINNSLIDSISKLFPKIMQDAVLLKEHYRCHPKIIGFCNKKYYNNQLIIMTKNDNNAKTMLVYKTVPGRFKNSYKQNYNTRQIDVITEEVLSDCNINIATDSLAIITPYKDQKKELKTKIGEINETEIDTIHKFQGREKNIVVFSTVKDVITNNFINEPMVNVAVSRATKQFIIIIPNDEKNIKNNNISDLVDYIRYNNMEVVESKVCSVFDLFHKEYTERLNKYKNIIDDKDPRVPSERLIKAILNELLNKKTFTDLKYFENYKIDALLRNKSLNNRNKILLSDEETYIKNGAHLDFLVYKNVDKAPILAIEVDGVTYHRNNPIQLQKDELKNSILSKIDIPIIRIKTDESMEKKKIYNELCRIRNIKPEINYNDIV